MSNFAAVLIDDDPLVHAGWTFRAERTRKEVLTLSTFAEFLEARERIPANVPIFIDANLGDDDRGEVRAQEIRAMGYEKVYLVTGYPEESFPPMPWLAGILGKTPPNWLF